MLGLEIVVGCCWTKQWSVWSRMQVKRWFVCLFAINVWIFLLRIQIHLIDKAIKCPTPTFQKTGWNVYRWQARHLLCLWQCAIEYLAVCGRVVGFGCVFVHHPTAIMTTAKENISRTFARTSQGFYWWGRLFSERSLLRLLKGDRKAHCHIWLASVNWFHPLLSPSVNGFKTQLWEKDIRLEDLHLASGRGTETMQAYQRLVDPWTPWLLPHVGLPANQLADGGREGGRERLL